MAGLVDFVLVLRRVAAAVRRSCRWVELDVKMGLRSVGSCPCGSQLVAFRVLVPLDTRTGTSDTLL